MTQSMEGDTPMAEHARADDLASQPALAKTGPGASRFELRPRLGRAPGPGEVRIAIAATGICGSDLHLWRGSLPWVEKAYPMWLGHEYSGTVTEVGAGVDPTLHGARVTAEPSVSCGRCASCLRDRTNLCANRRFEAGGFAHSVVVERERVHVLPEALPLQAGTLIEPLACAVHGLVSVARLEAGERCVVIGPGSLGVLAAFAARSQGAAVVLVGRPSSRTRLELAKAAGIDATHELAEDEAGDAIRDRLNGHDADVVVGCAGGSGTLQAGMSLLRPGGRYLELGLGSRPQTLDLDAVVTSEATILGAVGHRPAEWHDVLSRIELGALPARSLGLLVTGRFPLRAWREAFEAAADRRHLKVVIEPNRPGG